MLSLTKRDLTKRDLMPARRGGKHYGWIAFYRFAGVLMPPALLYKSAPAGKAVTCISAEKKIKNK